jgi:orotate phosphoribosyltransferase
MQRLKQWLKKANPRLYRTLRNLKKEITPAPNKSAVPLMEFRSLVQADSDVDEWVKCFPERYDLIVGIPRSGLIVAARIATKLGLPLSTPSCFLRGEIWYSATVDKPSIHHVLLVDDGVGRVNGQMQDAYAKIKAAYPQLKLTRAALYVYPDVSSAVELFFGYLNAERLNREEWNLLHRKHGITATDMDGFLCHDWAPTLYPSYDLFLEQTNPYLIPNWEIDFIVTGRQESTRQKTVAWLNRNGVKYRQLIMNNGHMPNEAFKAQTLRRLHPDLYIESNTSEAQFISHRSCVPVLSIEDMTLYSPHNVSGCDTTKRKN